MNQDISNNPIPANLYKDLGWKSEKYIVFCIFLTAELNRTF